MKEQTKEEVIYILKKLSELENEKLDPKVEKKVKFHKMIISGILKDNIIHSEIEKGKVGEEKKDEFIKNAKDFINEQPLNFVENHFSEEQQEQNQPSTSRSNSLISKEKKNSSQKNHSQKNN